MSWRLVTAEAGPCEQRATCLLLSPAIIPSLAERRLWKEQDWFKLPWGLRGNGPCRSLFFLSPLSSFVVVVVSLKLPLPKARIESLPGTAPGSCPPPSSCPRLTHPPAQPCKRQSQPQASLIQHGPRAAPAQQSPKPDWFQQSLKSFLAQEDPKPPKASPSPANPKLIPKPDSIHPTRAKAISKQAQQRPKPSQRLHQPSDAQSHLKVILKPS